MPGPARARDLVLGLAGSPPPDLALILTARIPSGSKAKFYTQLKKVAQSAEFSAITADDAPGWLMGQAQARFGMTIEPDAAGLSPTGSEPISESCRGSWRSWRASPAEGERITIEHVRTAGSALPEQDRWHWFDLVGGRKFDEALLGLRILLAQGESGVGLTVGLATHLLRIGIAVEQGQAALEQVLPPHQKWLSRQIARQADGWSSAAIREGILGLLRVDRLLKASSLSDEHHLEEWLLTVMTFEEAAA